MGDGIMSRFSKTWLKKLESFKYPALVLLIGLVLVLVPGRKAAEPEQPDIQTKTSEPASDEALAYLAQTEQRLASILSRINGAGQVDVMLTLRSGKAHQYQSDYRTETDHHETGDATQTEQKTVILSRGSAYDEPAVVKTEYPSFQGALIVSQGADNAQVRYALTCAVAALLDLGTDQITVVKMK